jgi:hypothetical protein
MKKVITTAAIAGAATLPSQSPHISITPTETPDEE